MPKTNALILDCERRLGPLLVELIQGMVGGVSLVYEPRAALRRVVTGLYDLVVLSGTDAQQTAAMVRAVEEHVPGVPLVLQGGVEGEPAQGGAFAAVLGEPFSERRFRDVVLALVAAPELVRKRHGRRREVDAAGLLRRQQQGGPALPCRVDNVSLGGVRLEVTTVLLGSFPLVDDDRVLFEGGIALGSREADASARLELRTPARVAYIDRLPEGVARVGLRFEELDPASSAGIAQLLGARSG